MEPRTRTRALTAAAVTLTAGVTLATTFLPSSAHAAEPAGRTAATQAAASESLEVGVVTLASAAHTTRDPFGAAGEG